ncbi:MAG: tyrosine-type recombinase/integrase [Planctomycetaceae bacterium]
MTGLRKAELASLTPQSFDLDSTQPTLTVEARASKRRRKDTRPLHETLVELVRELIADLPPDEPLFPKLARRKTWMMIKRDLEEAGIEYQTEEGIADFHADGRHTHITSLLKSGIHLVHAKELARHSDVRMTMKYTHIGIDDQA